MNIQRLYSLTRQAIDKYNMIEDGDKIAIGISGGKDSLTLLYALNGLRQFYPIKFEIIAVTVDLGNEKNDFSEIINLCSTLNIDYIIIKTDIYNIIFNERKESNPCSLCAKMRKGALNNFLLENNINKVAYAHHKDDVIETYLLSLFYEGRMNTFMPVTHLDKTNIKVIRPLILINEVDIIGFANKYNLPVVDKSCPADGFTKREYIKNLIKQLNYDNPGIKKQIYTAIENSDLKGWNHNG